MAKQRETFPSEPQEAPVSPDQPERTEIQPMPESVAAELKNRSEY